MGEIESNFGNSSALFEKFNGSSKYYSRASNIWKAVLVLGSLFLQKNKLKRWAIRKETFLNVKTFSRSIH
jgi:hypothetical protein